MGQRRRLLQLLLDRSPHAAADLERALRVDGEQLRRLIASLSAAGVELVGSPSSGWRLVHPLDLLCAARVRAQLDARAARLLGGLEVLEEVDSTNAYLMRRRGVGLRSGHGCFAEHQSSGRGRRGTRWTSPFGSNLYLSVYWCFPRTPKVLQGLSLAAGVAVAQALESLAVRGVGLKWPNDLMWGGKKLGGVLVEMAGGPRGPWDAVTGVGLNLAMPARAGEAIDQPWVNLDSAAARAIDRNQLAGRVLGHLLVALEQYARAGFAACRADWQRLDVLRGREVALSTPDGPRVGVAGGVDATGALLLSAGTQVERHLVGDVSVRPRR